METDTNNYAYSESYHYSLISISCIALDFCFLPFLLKITWNQSFATLHDSINDINWRTAFMLRICICCFYSVFSYVSVYKEHERRFYHFANMLNKKLQCCIPNQPYNCTQVQKGGCGKYLDA